MEIIIVILLGIIALLIGVTALKLISTKDGASNLLLRQQMDGMTRQFSEGLSSLAVSMNSQIGQISTNINQQLQAVNQRLQTTEGQIGNRLDSAAKVVGEVRQNLGELGKSAEKIYEIGKDISTLHDILRAPKPRGILGELFLGDMLSQIIPSENYSIQHRLKNGEIVDAVIRLKQGLVPVDSKFPLENFIRITRSKTDEEKRANKKKFSIDVKRHIDSIAAKYIVPDEGTFDFAIMYIPAENVYYEAIIKDETDKAENSLSAYAMSKRIIPTSPGTLYAYLQTIVLGLKGLQIEKSAREIHDNIRRLQIDFNRIREDFELVGKHMTNTRSRYEETSKRLDRYWERLQFATETSDKKNDT